jgi:hypothetical protein
MGAIGTLGLVLLAVGWLGALLNMLNITKAVPWLWLGCITGGVMIYFFFTPSCDYARTE